MEYIPVVKNYMITRLITLTRDMDVYFAIGLLLKNKISQVGKHRLDGGFLKRQLPVASCQLPVEHKSASCILIPPVAS